jgi:hypothetical protein
MNSGCEFTKKDQQRCKHSVSIGEKFCWQHAIDWRSRVRSLPRNTKVIFWIGVVSLLATFFGLFQHGNSKSIHVQTSGEHSPVVQDNQGSVTFNDSQSEQAPKKSSNSAKKPATTDEHK